MLTTLISAHLLQPVLLDQCLEEFLSMLSSQFPLHGHGLVQQLRAGDHTLMLNQQLHLGTGVQQG